MRGKKQISLYLIKAKQQYQMKQKTNKEKSRGQILPPKFAGNICG